MQRGGLREARNPLAGRVVQARGALAALAARPDVKRVVACSSGNHGMGVAYASRLLQRMAIIVVPEWANSEKVSAIQGVGRDGADVWP